MGGAGFRAFMLDLHQLNERPSLSYQVCQDLGGEIQVDISIANHDFSIYDLSIVNTLFNFDRRQ